MPHLRTSVKMRPFRPSALPVRALKIVEPTISLPAAVLFLAGAVVTWIVFDTEPPADNLRSLVGFFGFVAMAAGCALQGRRYTIEVRPMQREPRRGFHQTNRSHLT